MGSNQFLLLMCILNEYVSADACAAISLSSMYYDQRDDYVRTRAMTAPSLPTGVIDGSYAGTLLAVRQRLLTCACTQLLTSVDGDVDETPSCKWHPGASCAGEQTPDPKEVAVDVTQSSSHILDAYML